MAQKRKSPKQQQQQPTEEIQMAGNKDIMVFTGVKVKYLSLKENGYGHNHFFNVLAITPLQQLIELRQSLKIQIWGYNDKSYLSQCFFFLKLESYRAKLNLKKMCLILWI